MSSKRSYYYSSLRLIVTDTELCTGKADLNGLGLSSFSDSAKNYTERFTN